MLGLVVRLFVSLLFITLEGGEGGGGKCKRMEKLMMIGIQIVGVVTYERKKYRGQFRKRKMAAQISNAAGFKDASAI